MSHLWALSGAQLRSDVTAFIAREHAPAQQLIDVERQSAFDQLSPWSLKSPGCVKTHTSEKCRNTIPQHGIQPYVRSIISSHIAQFLKNISTRAADVEAFTQPGSLANMATSPGHVRFTPDNGQGAVHPHRHLAVRL